MTKQWQKKWYKFCSFNLPSVCWKPLFVISMDFIHCLLLQIIRIQNEITNCICNNKLRICILYALHISAYAIHKKKCFPLFLRLLNSNCLSKSSFHVNLVFCCCFCSYVVAFISIRCSFKLKFRLSLFAHIKYQVFAKEKYIAYIISPQQVKMIMKLLHSNDYCY